MNISCGIDIVKIDRFLKIQEKTTLNKFVKKIIPESKELFYKLYNQNKLNSAAFLAKRFSVKESVSKAIGCGICADLNFSDIVVLNDKFGKPFIEKNERIQNAILKYSEKKIKNFSELSISISFSDEKDISVSQCFIFFH